MKKFEVEVTETLQRVVVVEANDENEAEDKVQMMYSDQEIVLDASDFVDSEITLVGEAEDAL